ncbi:MAG: DMT family transporter [Planctomycetes bacterium]|nr:DMT family transporter [Planctomycetota bacterium]
MAHAGEIAALVTALCWTFSLLSFTAASRRIGSLSVNIIRLVIALLLFSAHGLIFRGRLLPTDAPAHTWLWLLLSGFVGFFLGDLCLFKSLMLVGPRLTSLLMSLAPPLTAILGIFMLGEHLTAWNWTGMAVTVLGVSWVILERTGGEGIAAQRPSLGGIALGALAALGQAAGLVFAKLGLRDDYDPFAGTHIRVMAGVAGFGVLLGLIGWYPRVYQALRQPRAVALVFFGAFLGPFLGVALLLLSVRTITTGVAQTIVSILPVTVMPFLIWLYRERVSARAFLGACIAIAGVAMLFLK